MGTYHFRLFRDNHEPAGSHFVVIESDGAAEEHAKRMLGQRDIDRIEVWGNGSLVSEVRERRGKRRRKPTRARRKEP